MVPDVPPSSSGPAAPAPLGTWQRDLRTGGTVWTGAVAAILGVSPRAADRDGHEFLDALHPDDRARGAELLALVAQRPGDIGDEGVHVELRIRRGDGTVRPVQVTGHVVRDARGEPDRWLAVLRDVTAQRLAEQELEARSVVTETLGYAADSPTVLVDLLDRVGVALDYPVCTLWSTDPDDRLVCGATWSAPDVDASAFARAEAALVFGEGEGLPGLAWRDRRPVVVRDVALSAIFHPWSAVGGRPLRSAVAFPVAGRGDPFAVITMYRFAPAAHSPTLERTLSAIGLEIGRSLGRTRAVRAATGTLSEREVEVLRLLGRGRMNTEIAGELGVSPATVKTHVEHVYRKLGVSDRVGAAVYALRAGVID